jgi:hypothetical protein
VRRRGVPPNDAWFKPLNPLRSAVPTGQQTGSGTRPQLSRLSRNIVDIQEAIYEKQMFSSAASAVLAMMFAFTTGCLQDTESASIESIDGAEHEEGVVPEDPPDPDTAEYVGDVDFVSDEEFDAALAAWHAQAAERPMYATDEELAASDDGSLRKTAHRDRADRSIVIA